MKNIFRYLGKSLGVSFLALAIVVGVGAGSAGATLTLDATSITTTAAYTVTTVAASTVNEFAANTTGNISIGGTAQTSGVTTILGGTGTGVLGGTTSGIALTPGVAGTINIGSATGIGAITVGASTGAGQTVTIGGGATTGSDIINIGTGTATTRKTVNIATEAISTTNIGTGNFVNTIHIGDNATPVNLITIGGVASSLALADAQWGITSPGVATFVNTLVSPSATTGLDTGTAGALSIGRVNATSVVIGNALTTAITLTTDNTGDGTDVVLPTGAISTGEILDNTVDVTDLATSLAFVDGDVIDLSATVTTTAAAKGLKLPQKTDCSLGITEGHICWDTDNDVLYVGNATAAAAISPNTASANTWTGVNTFQDNEIFTFAGDEDLAITNASATTVDPFSVTVTSTSTADAAQINLTIDDTAAANVVDTIAGLNIAVTSAATGEADILVGLNIANLTGANATVLERALVIGNGWDINQYFNDTTTFVKLANGGTLVLEDDSAADGVNLLSIADAGAIDVGTAVNTSISLTTDNNAANDIALVGGVTVTGSLVPEAATTRSLGGTSAEWGNIYVGDGSAADISTTGLIFGLDQDAILVYEENTSDRVELVGTNADLWIEDVLSLGRQTLTVTDDGVANDTLTMTASYVEVTQDATANAGVPDITFSETGVNEGDLLIVVRIDGNAGNVTINEADTVVESAGNITLSPTEFDSVTYIYTGTTWVQIAASENG